MPKASPFDIVPDPITRAAMEELLVPDAYRFVPGVEGYMPSPGGSPRTFLPEPAFFNTVSIAYLRDGAPGGIKQEFIALEPQLPPESRARKLYSASIDARQDIRGVLMDMVRNAGIEEWQDLADLKRFCVDTVRSRGRHVLAAHVVAQLVSDSTVLMDALVLPTEVSEGVSLRIRDALIALAAEVPSDNPDLVSIRPFLQGSPDMREPGAIVAATFLPRSSVLQFAFSQVRRHRRWQRGRSANGLDHPPRHR